MHASLHTSEGALRVLESQEPSPNCAELHPQDREWAEAALAGEKRVLEMIAGGRSLPLVLDALCRVVEEIYHGSFCSILLLDAKGSRFVTGAAPSLPSRYLEAFNGREIASCWGPCGAAALHKKQVIASDIQVDPLWEQCREAVLSYGLRACWSTPILSSDGGVLGTFAILSRQPCSPTPKHQGIIKQFTHLASIAIECTRGEEALRRSEAFLTEAQNLSHTGSFGWNPVTGKLVWSAETFRIMGYERTSTPTLEMVLNRVHPEDLPLVREMIGVASNRGKDLDFEHRLLMPDGTVKHLHVLAHATEDGSWGVEFVGAVMDVSDRKRTEEALRRSESRFEGILRIAEDAIISVDSRRRILLFNQGAEKVFGYAATEVMGQPLELLMPQRFSDTHRKHFEEFAKSPEISRTMAQRREVFGRSKDGREFPAEASISKLELGEEVVFTVILRDITERKEAAETLRASAQLARGQAEALTVSLDALAKESAPDRLVEHVLRTITRQLAAHSCGVWLRNEGTDSVSFEVAFEEGRLLSKTDAVLARISPTLKIGDVWLWPEVFRTGKPAVLEDVRQGPDFPWRTHVVSLGVISILIVPLLIAGQVEGVIGIRFTSKRTFRVEEMELAQALAHQAMLAIQLGRLSRRSRQAAVAAERNRMARDIHDTLAQGFTGVIVQLEAVEEAMSQGLAAKASECLARAGAVARESLREARRSVRALRPLSLEERDICEALQSLIRKATTGTGVQAEFSVRGQPPELPPEWEENLLRIGQEVLTNVLRHAQASKFTARLAFEKEVIRLELCDDGKGFDPAARHDGFGLQGMKERAEATGGRLTIRSARNEGTAISIVLPLPETLETVSP